MDGHRTLDRATIEKHLQIALNHVAKGERLVAGQRAVLARLSAHGHETHTARRLLAQFEEAQAMHIADRDRLAKELTRCTD